ncbi:hypothetical protein AMTRI_Chr05g62450 [Amborella trichopoda]
MAALNPSALFGYLFRIETLNGSNFSNWQYKKQIVGPTKALANTLKTKLLTKRYDGHKGFLMQFILHYLPAQCDQFKIVQIMCVKKEVRLNQNKLEVAHLVETSSGRK